MKLTMLIVGALALMFAAPIGCATHKPKGPEEKKMVIITNREEQPRPEAMAGQPWMNMPKPGAPAFGAAPGASMPQIRVQAGMGMGQGWFAQLPDQMKENMLEWMFYIMTHKPPQEGMTASGMPGNPEMEQRFKEAMAGKDETIKKQQEQIEQLQKAIQELKGKVDELQKKPNG